MRVASHDRVDARHLRRQQLVVFKADMGQGDHHGAAFLLAQAADLLLRDGGQVLFHAHLALFGDVADESKFRRHEGENAHLRTVGQGLRKGLAHHGVQRHVAEHQVAADQRELEHAQHLAEADHAVVKLVVAHGRYVPAHTVQRQDLGIAVKIVEQSAVGEVARRQGQRLPGSRRALPFQQGDHLRRAAHLLLHLTAIALHRGLHGKQAAVDVVHRQDRNRARPGRFVKQRQRQQGEQTFSPELFHHLHLQYIDIICKSKSILL